MNNSPELRHFEAIEFRLEIFSPSDFKYPPFFYDICRGASGSTGYRSLHRLKVENPALLENFRTLKVSTYLPADKIILELALSQRTNHDDYSAVHEQPIGTYLIGDGETVALPELAQCGLAPMIAKAVRLTAGDVPLDQIPQKNYTTGLQIVGIRKKANAHFITLKNVSRQTICRYVVGFEQVDGNGSHLVCSELLSNAEDGWLLHLSPYTILAPLSERQALPQEQTLVIGAALYDDNTCEGQGSWLLQMLFPPSEQNHPIMKLRASFSRLHAASESELASTLTEIRREAAALLKAEAAFSPRLKLRGQNWTPEEIVERAVLDWLHEQVRTALRTAERAGMNAPPTISEAKREMMGKQIERQQSLLRILLAEA